MSTPIHGQLTGTFTSDGAIRSIELPCGYSEFRMINITDIGSTAASTPVMRAQGTSAMAAGSAYYNLKTNGAATLALETTTTTGGFTFVADSSTVGFGAANSTITAISNASPPVVSLTSTAGLNNGDVIVLYATTGVFQLAGMTYTIGNIVTNTSFELSFVGTAPGSAGTAGTLRRIPFLDTYRPAGRFITAITKAANAVITLGDTHRYVAGMSVRIHVPALYGMIEMDGLLANIISVNTTTNTITTDIDSTTFTTFTYPTSAQAAAGVDFATTIPVGETANATYANSLDDATHNVNFRGVQIGTTVQTSGKLYEWFAYKNQSI